MRSTYGAATWLFLRLLGLIYFVAFWSLAVQILGLVGHAGISPAPPWASDTTLRVLCYAGAALALLLVAGIVPVATLLLLWLDYLALSTVCGEFLSYQWDALLLEAGLIALFVAPLVLRERVDRLVDPPRLARWLMLWLLFRLMAGSGAIKLASGDPTWRHLTALTFHYETQPIPTPIAWYAHRLPQGLQKLSALGVLAIELVAPWCVFASRRWRVAGFAMLVGLQSLIALTGNYAFFNLLSAALCLFLIDDQTFGRAATPSAGRARHGALVGFSIATVPVSIAMFFASLGVWFAPPPVGVLAELVAPLRSVNSYGLFAVMTTERDEIIVEGSNDGATWLAYEFPYKAGDVNRRPPWVAPHQPRLDWQMWFASLTTYPNVPWFRNFCARLLEGSPDVLRLLSYNPFPDRPPRYVRGVLYRYRFAGGCPRCWWTRERLSDYSPVLTADPGSRN